MLLLFTVCYVGWRSGKPEGPGGAVAPAPPAGRRRPDRGAQLPDPARVSGELLAAPGRPLLALAAARSPLRPRLGGGGARLVGRAASAARPPRLLAGAAVRPRRTRGDGAGDRRRGPLRGSQRLGSEPHPGRGTIRGRIAARRHHQAPILALSGEPAARAFTPTMGRDPKQSHPPTPRAGAPTPFGPGRWPRPRATLGAARSAGSAAAGRAGRQPAPPTTAPGRCARAAGCPCTCRCRGGAAERVAAPQPGPKVAAKPAVGILGLADVAHPAVAGVGQTVDPPHPQGTAIGTTLRVRVDLLEGGTSLRQASARLSRPWRRRACRRRAGVSAGAYLAVRVTLGSPGPGPSVGRGPHPPAGKRDGRGRSPPRPGRGTR